MIERDRQQTEAAPRIRSVREETTSAAIEGSAACASVVGLFCLVSRALPGHDAVKLGAVVVYGLSMIIAFTASALYHGVQHERLKPLFREIDHCTIFLFIAGTYTAVTMLALRHQGGRFLLAAIWALAIAGITLRLKQGAGFLRTAVSIYLVMGWLFLGWSVPLYRAVGWTPMLVMIAGGLLYSGGLLFHRWDRLPYSVALWHICVVTGSACFFYAIALFPQL